MATITTGSSNDNITGTGSDDTIKIGRAHV